MKKHLFLFLVAMMLLGWSSIQAQDVVEVNASATQVTQDFDGMWDNTAGEATLAMPQGWRVDRNMTAPRTVGSFASATTTVMYSGGTSLDDDTYKIDDEQNLLFVIGDVDVETDRDCGSCPKQACRNAETGTRCGTSEFQCPRYL